MTPGGTADLRHADLPVSELLAAVRDALPPDGVTVRDLLERLGERGILVACIVLASPFLLPVSIPGSSAPLGFLDALLGLGLVANRVPWLPARILDHRVSREKLARLLDAGRRIFLKLERILHPRLLGLTHERTAGRVNGIALVASSVFLMAPLPLPLSNTIPAYAVVLLAAGSLERDGYVIIAGYVMAGLSMLYLGAVGLLGVAGVKQAFSALWGGAW